LKLVGVVLTGINWAEAADAKILKWGEEKKKEEEEQELNSSETRCN
jgi:hypothetical protein